MNSDPAVKGASRVMRLLGSWYIDSNGQPVAQCRILPWADHYGRAYDADDFDDFLPQLPEPKPAAVRPVALIRNCSTDIITNCAQDSNSNSAQ